MATDQLGGILGALDQADYGLDLDVEVDATGHILDLLLEEFLGRAEQWTQTPGGIAMSPNTRLPREVGSTLRDCCLALIARDAADPELLRGLALALGDFDPDEIEAFVRNLPAMTQALRS